ncbi:MAG: hypothetical protein QGM50_02945 [Anaerolineae bacterium]|nr:hypothetical protein [Anaerolineae bacterium]MDK1080789.1 hypothetical protein [Anaerolineae bacterium]MDK1117727.1 hypothetical protein [Anaerolineae bacterium]
MRVFAVAIAFSVGLLVLLGYFVPSETLLVDVRLVLVQWAVILAAVAVLVGVLNLLGVHWQKIQRRQKGGAYSILLIVSLFSAAVLGIFVGTDSPTLRFYLEAIIIPAEATLMALLAVTLVYASARLLRHRPDLMSFLFLGTAVITLFAAAPLPFGKVPPLNLLSDFLSPWLTQVFATAGSRGILIGIALGAITTGLRAMFGIDRQYGGN